MEETVKEKEMAFGEGMLKEFGLGFFLITLSILSGYFWSGIGSLGNGQFIGRDTYIELGILVFLSFVFILFSTLTTMRWLMFTVFILSSFSFFIFHPFQNIYIVGIILAVCFFLLASRRMRREVASRETLNWRVLIRNNAGAFFTALAISFSLLYFTTTAPKANIEDVFIPKTLFVYMTNLFEKPIQSFIPGFKADATVDDILVNLAVKEFGENVKNLPPANLKNMLAEGRAQFSGQLGITLSGKETAADVFYEYASDQIEKYTLPYTQYIPIVLTVGYFTALRFFFYLFSLIISIIFPALALVLFKIGFLQKKSIMVEKQVVIL